MRRLFLLVVMVVCLAGCVAGTQGASGWASFIRGAALTLDFAHGVCRVVEVIPAIPVPAETVVVPAPETPPAAPPPAPPPALPSPRPFSPFGVFDGGR
jgi:hypothetical protein